MSFLSKVAVAAAMTLSIAGLAAASSAGLAAEAPAAIVATPPAAIAPQVANVVSVPSPVPAVADVQPGDSVVYPTLAAAVAAQQTQVEISQDLRCLAGAIYFESKGEPLDGQLAVAEVILNRAESKRFGGSICGVVTQPGQFSFVRGGRVPDIDSSRPAWRTALAVAQVALNDAWESSAGDALYFHARRVGPGWGHVKVASIGNHIFYR